jgi:hypothetical protein
VISLTFANQSLLRYLPIAKRLVLNTHNAP